MADPRTPRVNRISYIGLLKQNDGYLMEAPGGEWVKAADARAIEIDLEAEKESHCESLAMYRSARDRAEQLKKENELLRSALLNLTIGSEESRRHGCGPGISLIEEAREALTKTEER